MIEFDSWTSGFVLFMCLFGIEAQPQGHVIPLNFRGLTIEDGLSQSTITALLQDHQGYMWIGTEDGLNRWDGYEMVNFRNDPSKQDSLADNRIFTFLEDDQQRLWIATYHHLQYLNPDRNSFTRIALGPYDRNATEEDMLITKVAMSHNRDLWVATYDQGIFIVSPDNLERRRLHKGPGSPLALTDNHVFDLFTDDRGKVWATQGQSLLLIDPETLEGKSIPISLPEKNISDVLITRVSQDHAGDIWLATQGSGLFRMDRHNFQITGHWQFDEENPITDFQLDDQGRFWIVNDRNHVLRFSPAANEWVYYQSVAPERHTNQPLQFITIQRDRSGMIWVGSQAGGVHRFHPDLNAFHTYRNINHDPDSLTNNVVISFAEDHQGAIWVGTEKAGLDRFDVASGTFTNVAHDPENPNSLSDNQVVDILPWDDQTLWVATSRGLNQLNTKTGECRRYGWDGDREGGLKDDLLNDLLLDRKNRIWVATFSAGIALFDPDKGTFTHYGQGAGQETSLSHQFVTTMSEDPEGILWLGTEAGGLNRFDPETGRFQAFTHNPENPRSISHNSIGCIFADRPGELWIGTYGGGLNRFDTATETFTSFRIKDGLPNETLYGILADDEGHLWISSNRGLSRFSLADHSFTNFTVGHGLQSDEFNYGAYLRARDGTMYFGGIAGFNRFRPSEVRVNQYIPPIVITKLHKINRGQEIPLPHHELEQIELEYRDQVLSVSFAALDYRYPEHNQFAYKLGPTQSDWTPLGQRHEITFSNLPAGTYHLRVKGSNQDGIWNETGQLLTLVVLPPLWLSAWAYALYALLLTAAATYAWHYYRVRQEKQVRRAVAMSREEFANTVLHNVGNLLNSLTISSNKVDRIIGQSKLQSLVKALGLLERNLPWIGDYLQNDPKGKLLPEYFVTMTTVSQEEHGDLNKESEEIRQKVQLMREIIEDQQENAKNPHEWELADLNDLINDAVSLHQELLRRHEVEIRKVYSILQAIPLSKTQAMHVLINLIKNAVEAMADHSVLKRVLTFETGLTDDELLYVSIADTGVGISEENKKKLFSYGFTTKQQGHGFGLSFCSKVMNYHKGRIKASSEGQGKGAKFTLYFPTNH